MSTLAEYSIQFSVKGSKMAVKEMEDILKKLNQVNSKTKEETKVLDQETEAFARQEKQINKNSSALWTLGKRLLTLGAVIGVVKKAWSLGVNFAQEGQNIKFMANSANITARDFQKWSYVAKKYGGNEGNIASVLQNIDMQMENAKYGQVPMQEIAAKYGITLASGGTAEDFLKLIAKKMESMDRRSQLAMGRAFGFDEATIRMLQLGLKGLTEELAKAESKVAFDNDQIEKADQLNKKLVEIKQQFHMLAVNLGGEMADSIVTLSNLIIKIGKQITILAHEWFKDKGVGESIGEYIAEDKGNQIWIQYIGKNFIQGAEELFGVFAHPIDQIMLPYLKWHFAQQGKIFDKILSGIALIDNPMLSTITNGAVSTITNDNQIVINGAANPQVVAGEVIKALDEWTSTAELRKASLGFVSPEK